MLNHVIVIVENNMTIILGSFYGIGETDIE